MKEKAEKWITFMVIAGGLSSFAYFSIAGLLVALKFFGL